MRYVALVIALFALASLATHVSAQTPDEATPTPEPTELAAPTPTATATPITAAPDEIVFTGELAVPAGTTVSALFEGRTSATCATGNTEAAGEELSSFVLRVPASCAEDRFGPTICWSDTGCYLYLAGRPRCTVLFGDCGWSDIVAPGKVVDFGAIPIAGSDEIIILGEVPVPLGATVRVLLGDFRSNSIRIVFCGSTTTTSASAPSSSMFTLHVEDSCSRGLDFPSICWSDPPCHHIPYDHPFVRLLLPGRTIVLAPFLDEYDPNATATPLPGVPNVGRYQGRPGNESPAWLSAVLAGLLAVALGLGAGGLALRRRSTKD